MACLLARLRPDWTVTQAPSPYAALTSIDRDPPDVAVVDMLSPGMAGLELAQYLRERFPALPVAVVGSEPGRDGRHNAERLGCLFIPKPITPERLRHFVQALAC